MLEQYSRPRQNGVNAITIREDDSVIEVRMTNGNNEIIIANRNGRAIRFHEAAVRVMGRTATGVRGITLDNDGQEDVYKRQLLSVQIYAILFNLSIFCHLF